MVNINWQFQAAIQGGPAFIVNQPVIVVDGYDVVEVTIPATSSNVAVSIPAGEILFVVVSSSQYDAGLSYTVDAVATDRALDAPHMLVGSGAVGFLNSTPPQKLTFKNSLANDVNVQVTIGRKLS